VPFEKADFQLPRHSKLGQRLSQRRVCSGAHEFLPDHRVRREDDNLMAVFRQFPRSPTAAPATRFVQHQDALPKFRLPGHDRLYRPDASAFNTRQDIH